MNHFPNHIKIIPGILESNWQAIEEKILISQKFTDTLHIDIIDGIFVDNKTFIDPKPFTKYSAQLFLELHMMVDNPIKYIEPFARAGFKRFIGHIEMMPDQEAFLTEARKYGEAGLAVDGPTPIETITVSLSYVDCFLIYTSEKVGFSGPPLLTDRLEKVTSLRESTNVPIEVDGGINEQTAPLAVQAGATSLATTSFLFSGHDPQQQFEQLRNLVNQEQ